MQIWGRANSVNVQKVVWCCEELLLPYERIDAGGKFGVVDTPAYRAMNPNGKVPTLVDGDFILWESNSILRYVALRAGDEHLYPQSLRERVLVERWLDWALSTLQPAERNLFWGMIRTAPAQRDHAAIELSRKQAQACWDLLDTHLGDGRAYVETGRFTLADVVLGAYVHRWFGMPEIERADFVHLRAWYERLLERPAYRRHVAVELT